MAWSPRRMIVAGLIDGNRVTNLESGVEVFPAMLQR
jgi:hypothetical protein